MGLALRSRGDWHLSALAVARELGSSRWERAVAGARPPEDVGLVQQTSATRFEYQLELLHIGEMLAVSDAILGIGEAKRRDVVGIPAPRDAGGIQLAHERVLVVDRHFGIVAAPGAPPDDRIQPI